MPLHLRPGTETWAVGHTLLLCSKLYSSNAGQSSRVLPPETSNVKSDFLLEYVYFKENFAICPQNLTLAWIPQIG